MPAIFCSNRRRRLADIDQQQTDVTFLDCRQGAQNAELFDADLNFAAAADTGGVEQLKDPAFETEPVAVDVAGRAGPFGNISLLFLEHDVEKGAFADVRPADEGEFETLVPLPSPAVRQPFFQVSGKFGETSPGSRAQKENVGDPEPQKVGLRRPAVAINFIGDQNDLLAALKRFLRQLTIFAADWLRSVDQQADKVGDLDRRPDLFLDAGFEIVFRVLQTGGIGQPGRFLAESDYFGD